MQKKNIKYIYVVLTTFDFVNYYFICFLEDKKEFVKLL
jgi:hypothetical protein